MTEREKMLMGVPYDANGDDELLAMRRAADELCREYNALGASEAARAWELLGRLFGRVGDGAVVMAPLWVDYGWNVELGAGSFINRGAYLMDCGAIRIGERCFIGPNFGAYTASHPLDAATRARGIESAAPITIEDDVWIGGDVTILGGVTIGRGSVIGAKSLVTRDVPPGMVAAGHPCRPLRPVPMSE